MSEQIIKIGDCRVLIPTIPDNSIDCVVTSPPYWCYSEDTEILTYDGWKNISSVNTQDKVLSVNPSSMVLEWSVVNNTNKQQYQGKMVHFKNRQIDLLVTPNHKMFAYSNKYGHYYRPILCNGERSYFVKACDIKSGHLSPKSGFIWIGEKPKHFTLPRIQVMYNKQDVVFGEKKIKIDDWLAFFGLWIAEGAVSGSNGGKKTSYAISIKQKYPKSEEVKEVLRKLPFDFSEYKDKERNISKFNITDRQLWEYLKQFGNSHNKYIPKEIKEMSPKLLNIFLKWYLFGDGHIVKTKIKGINYQSQTCYTVSSLLKNDISEIALKIGSNTSVDKTNNRITFSKNKNIKIGECKYSQDYDGFVYCIELETNHIFVVRRNNKICVSGNSKRDYKTYPLKWQDGSVCQLGQEPTPQLFVKHLVDILATLKPKLKDTGSMWINLGDSYSSSTKDDNRKPDEFSGKISTLKWAETGENCFGKPQKVETGLPDKCLCLIPERFAISMVDNGFILRNIVIWKKPNAIP